MIDAKKLLTELKRQLKLLEDDLRARVAEYPELNTQLQTEWQAARDAKRTAETFAQWADQLYTQAGVHWLLACVFLRFIEDNELVERPWLTGTAASGRQALARDRRDAYFRANPLETDREFLLACFREAGALPGLQAFFDPAHNPVFRLGLSGDAAMALYRYWEAVEPDTGALKHDFTDPSWNTRFLGDLYQDLSEAARKRYALLQTPEFVEEFILDRTLTPALAEFGYRDLRMLDPTCGSGHFLLGGFARMVDAWRTHEPSRNPRDIAQKALHAVCGVDLNPFAIAIARFRLLVAALQVCEVRRLADAPNLQIELAVGDSLLHGRRFGLSMTDDMFDRREHFENTGLEHAYAIEDLEAVQRLLGRQYHAVVGNPPYIVVRDAALNAAYRAKYTSCHRQYSLGVPFTERFFELANTGLKSASSGFVGLITTDTFMKREFGSRLVEQVLPKLDLTHVVHTAGAYIPGHGTPTVILFGRHRGPTSSVVRTVMSIRGEPGTPTDPATGLVWTSISKQIDEPGSANAYIGVSDVARQNYSTHPWSIGGGGAAELKELIESGDRQLLSTAVASMGFYQDTHADEIFVLPTAFFSRADALDFARSCPRGDGIRDWSLNSKESVLFPYDEDLNLWVSIPDVRGLRWLWDYRTTLWSRSMFGGLTYREAKRPWWDFHQFPKDRARSRLLIAFSFVATHNHFILDRDRNVFNRSAPVIRLSALKNEDDHIQIIGVLNSSVACFWLKQVCQDKAGSGIGRGLQSEAWEARYEFNASNIAEFPLAPHRPMALARTLETLARDIEVCLPVAQFRSATEGSQPLPTRQTLDESRDRTIRLQRKAVALQEELDWQCYALYGLIESVVEAASVRHDDPPPIQLGERAFEIVLARRIVDGSEETSWFTRHRSTPITDLPAHWPEDYRRVVQRRIELIEADRNIGLIERPEYKRRWNTPSWEELETAALRDWLLDHLESAAYWPRGEDSPQLTSTRRLADSAQKDERFMEVAALYAGHADFDVADLVAKLVIAEAVPFLPVQRYTETGLRKREQWEATWALQRREDAGASVGTIPVPPKYNNKDFQRADLWRLRGGLDVPKERWVSYPGCERGVDGSLVIAWAGWDHLQQATALAAYYLNMKEVDGWPPERLQPLLAGLLELLPWLRQWHNEPHPEHGERMGDYYAAFIADECRDIGCTEADLRAWQPPAPVRGRGRKKGGA